MPDPSSQRLTIDSCREWLAQSVFRLRPKDYCEKYPKWPGMVGVELEMLVVRDGTVDQPKPELLPLGGKDSIGALLQDMAPEHHWTAVEMVPPEVDFIAKVDLDQKDQLTFEPGGQLEFSSKPYPCLSDTLNRLVKVQGYLDRAFHDRSARIVQTGINPWLTVEQIGLQMHKPRYRAMDAYFAQIGEYGQRMMRQTCTVQVNLDFGGDERTLAKRYLAANLIAPLATATFANSPLVDGQVTGLKSFRSRVWRGLDGTRTGFPPGLERVARELTHQSCVDAYLESVLAGRVVFVTALGYRVMDGKLTFGEWLERPVEGTRPTAVDFDTHLSLHFLEVRPRGFLELRSVDCQSRVWQAVPAAYYTALLYDDQALDQVLALLEPHLDDMTRLLDASARGLDDDDVARLATAVMDIATEAFRRLPPCFQGEGTGRALETYASHFTRRRQTPADDLLARLKERGKVVLTPSDFLAMEADWAKLV